MMTPAEKQKAYRARLRDKRAPIDHQCDRLRRLLKDYPEFILKFDAWMINRNDEIKKGKGNRVA